MLLGMNLRPSSVVVVRMNLWPRVFRLESFLGMAMLGLTLASARAEWPAWRGPAGNGSVATGTFPVRWSVDSVAWKVALPGKGGSTPVVWRDRIHLSTPADGQDAVLALDFSGKQVWQTVLGKESP